MTLGQVSGGILLPLVIKTTLDFEIHSAQYRMLQLATSACCCEQISIPSWTVFLIECYYNRISLVRNRDS